MTMMKLGAVLVTGLLTLSAMQTPAAAASPITEAFLANLTPNVDFLDRSSRFALTNSKNGRLRAFAHDQARQQTLAANAIDAWIEGGPVASTAPDGQLATGRSVAVDGQPARLVDNRLPMGQEDLDSLEGLSGADFDTMYKQKQINALRQIVYDYEDYVVRGDDPTLMALAKRELPKVKRRLGDLENM